jgi:RES domain-containing protein
LDFPNPAVSPARYHRRGDPGVWYAALTERAVWAELLRHHEPDISPWEVRRRVGRARLEGLRVLDLANPVVRGAISVRVEDLVSDDLARCQKIAAWAQRAGYEGILAPSAALGGEAILAVFASAMGKVTEEHSRVQRPPRRMGSLVPRIPRA